MRLLVQPAVLPDGYGGDDDGGDGCHAMMTMTLFLEVLLVIGWIRALHRCHVKLQQPSEASPAVNGHSLDPLVLRSSSTRIFDIRARRILVVLEPTSAIDR